MKTLKKTWKTVMDLRKAAVVLPLVLLLAQAASAGIIYEGQTGTRSYLSADGTMTMYVNIRFAVYDNELDDFYTTAPGPERYIYQYIVENKSTSELPVGFFSVIAGPSAGMAAIGTAFYTGGVDATTKEITTVAGVKQSADFTFSQTPVDIGGNSYLLMFTSNNSYKKDGSAVVKENDGSIVVPGDDVPEPLTALMLGLGALVIIRRKKI